MGKGNWEKNLASHQFTSEQSREEAAKNGSKGGTNSGVTRRRKRNAKQTAKFVLDLIPKLNDDTAKAIAKMGVQADEVPTIQLVSMLALAQKAMKGDAKALEKLLELSGYTDARDQLERDRLKLDIERLKFERERAKNQSDGKGSNALQVHLIRGEKPKELEEPAWGVEDDAP